MEMMFDGGMPMIEGTWTNPNTGDSFTVRDTFFEDNNYVILTMDGRRITASQMQNYIKGEGNKPIPKKQKPAPPKIKANIPEAATWDDLLTDEDKALLSSSPTPIKSTPNSPIPTKSTNEEILDRALKDLPMPKVKFSISWEELPKNEICMLNSLMKIPIEELSSYICKTVTLDNIKSQLDDEIKGLLIDTVSIP